MHLSKDIFRAYDIRGIVGESLSPEIIFAIAKALGKMALDCQQNTVIIGRDGRLSGPLLNEALKNGLLAAGCDVIDIGRVPTPVLYFATYFLSTQSGIMLTGSHNPVNYNGLKMVIKHETLAEEKIAFLYQETLRQQNNQTPQAQQIIPKGRYQEKDILPDYIARICKDIKLSRPLKIVIDAGNGIAGIAAPALFERLGCEVIPLYCEVDGNFPHHHPDPSEPHNLAALIQAVKEQQADIGFAFDGDGDRLGVIDNQGLIIWPDRQMMLYAKDILSRHPGEKIIFDVKCTQHLASIIQQFGGRPEMYKTGHSLIKKRLSETNAPLAGEMSGHIFFKERWYGFDDGLYTGARLLEILSRTAQSSYEIFQAFPNSINTPELKLSVTAEQKALLLDSLSKAPVFSKATIITIDGLRIEFKNGWGLIRASNTTPHLILRFESEDQAGLHQVQSYFREEILRLEPTLHLPF